MDNEVERLVTIYDRGGLSRRQLLQGLLALGIGPYAPRTLTSGLASAGQSAPPFQTRSLNHVTLYASNVARSKAFYQRLTGLPIRDEAKDFWSATRIQSLLLRHRRVQPASCVVGSQGGRAGGRPFARIRGSSLRARPRRRPGSIRGRAV